MMELNKLISNTASSAAITAPQQQQQPAKNSSFGGKLLIAATGGVGLGLTVICASFVAPALRRYCLPYVPATNDQISHVLFFLPKPQLTTASRPLKLLDIGSGDGRIAIAAAKHSKAIKADGVELNPWLVLYSRLSSRWHGVNERTSFFRKDLWNFPIRNYNYIIIFGVEQMMHKLEKKLIDELSPDAKIIACRFPLPNLQPKQITGAGVNTVWLYELPNSIKSK